MCVATRGGGEARPECRSRPTQPITESKERPRLYPVLPEKPEDLLDPAVAPPPYPLQRPGTAEQKEEVQSPPHTRGGTQYGEAGRASPHGGAAILPLREAPPPPDAPLRALPRLIYVPFSTNDLYNWKHQNPPFSEKPQGLISLLETIFRTHQPTWDDCQQILQTLFTSEERDRILSGAAKAVMGEEGETAAGRREVEDILPSQPPD